MDYYLKNKSEMRRYNKDKAKNSRCKIIMYRQHLIVNRDKIFDDSDFKYWKSCKFFNKDSNNEVAIIKEFNFKDDPTVFCLPAVRPNKPAKRFNRTFGSTNSYQKIMFENS